MSKIVTKIIMTALVSALTIGCGSANKDKTLSEKALENTPDDYNPIDAILGANAELDTASVEQEDHQEQLSDNPATAQDQDYVGGTMAVFLPTVTANGEEIKAIYRIAEATAEGTVVKEGLMSGVETEVMPGTYDITFTTKKIAGQPEMTLREVKLEAGRIHRRNVKFPVGTITLDTPGKGCRTSKILIKQKDASNWMPGKYTTCKPIMLMAGEYVAKQGVTEIKGIIVYDGGTRTVSIRGQ